MKIQPIDSKEEEEMSVVEVVKPVAKSRIKRLFDRQFSVLKYSAAADKITAAAAGDGFDKGSDDVEPSSVCLRKMVQNFMEGGNYDKYSVSSNCFNANCDFGSDTESETYSSSAEPSEILKGLVVCASVCERNLLADTAKIVEKNKMVCKRKDQVCRNIVTQGLIAFGYDASVCKSRWEKSPYYPAGEYEYIDVMIEKERVLIDIDFRSEFEIARSTKAYKAILQGLPYIFVGKCDRLQSIIAVASEAAKQSLKKKGMPVPPWRKLGYVKAKWLSTYIRTTITPALLDTQTNKEETKKQHQLNKSVLTSGVEDKPKMVVVHWKLPEAKPKSIQSGLAAFFAEKTEKF
ncbi:hypothetical protein Lal_00032895 [Lupinus albus]|uniref:Uncharacterized protein n=1 Tax=Lupinus albus TaxID=3870 RepID=A0A6A5PNI3_LUPAL|nr:hypothetical protein Lalb_Chr01g0019931 [Lupinus albus]KAF1898130.1 hypothetical protein Lal_00032895 [Lupinus albus]